MLVCFLFVGCYLLLQTISFRESRRYYFAGHFLRPNCAVVAAKSLPKPPRHRAARLSECTADRPSEQAYEHEASLHTYTYTKLGESGHYYTHVPSRYHGFTATRWVGNDMEGTHRPHKIRVATLQQKQRKEEGQRPTTNDQRPTTNDQRTTTNDQRPTTNEQQTTNNERWRRTTNNERRHRSPNKRQTPNDEHRTPLLL